MLTPKLNDFASHLDVMARNKEAQQSLLPPQEANPEKRTGITYMS